MQQDNYPGTPLLLKRRRIVALANGAFKRGIA